MLYYMRIAVITLHRVYNYGSALQAYATQKYLEKRGHNVRIIDYITPQRTKWKLFWGRGADGQNNIVYRIAKVGSFILKELTFGGFVRSKLNLTKKNIRQKRIYISQEAIKHGIVNIMRA